MTPTRSARAWKPTRVQRSVLELMKDGWWVGDDWEGEYMLRKPNEASRHVSKATMRSLIWRGVIKDIGTVRENWVLA